MRFELTQPFGHYPLKVACLPIPPPGHKGRAKNGTRTRDPNLGKVVLYQLSYFRIHNFDLKSGLSRFCDAKLVNIIELCKFLRSFFNLNVILTLKT